MMRRLAPGRCPMTHYAFATSLMHLVLVPANMFSGPLAELLGFSTFFLVVMLASVPSVWAAWKAPFPLASNGRKGAEVASSDDSNPVIIDDPDCLTSSERAVQLLAVRASIYAMRNIVPIL